MRSFLRRTCTMLIFDVIVALWRGTSRQKARPLSPVGSYRNNNWNSALTCVSASFITRLRISYELTWRRYNSPWIEVEITYGQSKAFGSETCRGERYIYTTAMCEYDGWWRGTMLAWWVNWKWRALCSVQKRKETDPEEAILHVVLVSS